MKKLIAGLALMLAACTNQEEEPPDIEGFVMDEDEDQVLVVEESGEDDPASHGAVWASGDTSGAATGDHVQLWYDDGAAESYPLQAEIGRIDVVDSMDVDGAELDRSGALHEALEDRDVRRYVQDTIASPARIAYREAERSWEILFVSGVDDDSLEVIIADAPS
ncbi:DUF3221 domain-containing protein [Alkalicoccus chagannorensis]|uniref:DUF3221 domain-containing protein n=1 Tax=Alkalicoccus chagannorensis TaxID=427072 RepID=UPI000407DC96|nr:DUF3221 domain-containing protein [Alkalicoccus chagannorensis]